MNILMAVALILGAPGAEPQDDRLKEFGESFKEKEKDEEEGKGKDKGGKGHKKDRDDRGHDGGHSRGHAYEADSCDSEDNILAEIFVDVMLAAVAYPFFDQGMRFQDYPYADGRRYFRDPDTADKEWAADFRMSVSRVEHDLWGNQAAGTLRFPSGCDFRFDISRYVEENDGTDDRFTLQEYEMNYGVAGSRRSWQMTLGWGVGAIDFEEADVSDVGPSAQLNVTAFPREPVSIRFHAGLIGFTGDTLTDLQLEAGLHLNRFAITAGVRSLINSSGDDLTGPTLGLAVSF